MLRQVLHQFTLQTRGRGLHEFTGDITEWVASQEIKTGLVTLLLRHTSASLLIQENADPDVRSDLEAFFSRLVPDGDEIFQHVAEGDDDMPAHVRTALTTVNLSIPVLRGKLALGTWQGVYLWEHRNSPHSRVVAAHFLGE